VKRLAASLEVAARGNGFSRKQRTQIVTAAVTRYRMAMRNFAGGLHAHRTRARRDAAARAAYLAGHAPGPDDRRDLLLLGCWLVVKSGYYLLS
jgi:hypothetical protein